MKVVFITIDTPFGTKESYILNELDHLSNCPLEYYVFPIRGAGKVSNKEYSKRILPRKFRFPFYIYCVRKFVKISRVLGYIISRQKPKRKFYTIYLIKKIALLSYCVETNLIDHIHAYWASSPSTVALAASMITGCTWSFTAHRADIENNDLLYEKIDRACFVRSISHQGLGKLSLIHPGRSDKMLTVHMGVCITGYKNWQRKIRSIRIVCVCDLIESKNISKLIERLAKSKINFSLDIFGNGPLKQKLQQQIEQSGLENKVRILNRVENKKLIDKYQNQRYDVLVHPSKIEGIPVAVMEAMASGVIVATTLAGATGELVNSRNSYILDSDLSNLEEILRLCLKSENNHRRTLARQTIREGFNVIKTSREIFKKITSCRKVK